MKPLLIAFALLLLAACDQQMPVSADLDAPLADAPPVLVKSDARMLAAQLVDSPEYKALFQEALRLQVASQGTASAASINNDAAFLAASARVRSRFPAISTTDQSALSSALRSAVRHDESYVQLLAAAVHADDVERAERVGPCEDRFYLETAAVTAEFGLYMTGCVVIIIDGPICEAAALAWYTLQLAIVRDNYSNCVE